MGKIYIDWQELLSTANSTHPSSKRIKKVSTEQYIVKDSKIKNNPIPFHHNRFNQSKKHKLLMNIEREISERLLSIGLLLNGENFSGGIHATKISTEDTWLDNKELNLPY